MNQTFPFLETYLLKLTYYTLSEPTVKSDLPYETHTAVVQVTNVEDRRLSRNNLESLALSIPGLNHRAMGKPRAHMSFHPVHLEVEDLPWDSGTSLRTRAQLTSPSHTQPRTPSANQTSSTGTAAKLLLPPARLPLLARHDSSHTGDWLMSDEWTTVAYDDRDYIRSFCSTYCSGDDVDVLGCCSVSDYTTYGQPVFSVYMDFLCEDKQTGNDLKSNSKQDEVTKDQDVETSD